MGFLMGLTSLIESLNPCVLFFFLCFVSCFLMVHHFKNACNFHLFLFMSMFLILMFHFFFACMQESQKNTNEYVAYLVESFHHCCHKYRYCHMFPFVLFNAMNLLLCNILHLLSQVRTIHEFCLVMHKVVTIVVRCKNVMSFFLLL
jgi:hypothetical protein